MSIKLPTFNTLCQQCSDIHALDYFFAKSLLEQTSHVLPEAIQECAFELLLALSWAQRQGHSCLALDQISNKILWHDAHNEKPGKRFQNTENLRDLAREFIAALPSPKALVLEGSRLFTARAHNFESGLQQQLQLRLKHEPVSDNTIEKLTRGDTPLWKKLFPHNDKFTNTNWQAVAVALALFQPLLILSGGPGTGKTFTVARLLIALLAATDKSLKIGLAAPTGKAAQRLNESLNTSLQAFQNDSDIQPLLSKMPEAATTIHRLLGLRESSVSATYNEQNPLPYDILIIDESSMLDLALFARIVRAIKSDCRLVFVGDVHQLPAVEAGNVLPMLLPTNTNVLSQQQQYWLGQFDIELPASAKTTPGYCVELQQTHRFNDDLGHLATMLRGSISDQVQAQRTWGLFTELSANASSGVRWVNYNDFSQHIDQWVREYFVPIARQSSVQDALALTKRFRILTALKKGELGSENLNEIVEQKLKLALGVPALQRFYRGRMVIVQRNAPGLNLFNGDIGVVWQNGSQLSIYFESGQQGKYRVIGVQRFSELDSVFAMTIHKSQGSEFDHVAVVLPASGGEDLLSNELIYTAVTRAKKSLSVVTNAERFQASIISQSSRWSGISPLHSDVSG